MLLILLWLPLPVGSNHLWAWSSLQVGIFLLTMVWLALFATGRVHTTLAFRRGWPVILLFVLVAGLTGLQLLQLPMPLISWLSPNTAEIHAQTLTGTTLSLDPSGTRAAALKTLSYGALFAMTLLLVERSNRLRILAVVLVFSGVVQSLFGVFMTLTGLELGFIVEKVHHVGLVTGTFVNANHLAGYLGMSLALAIGLLLAAPAARWAAPTLRTFKVDFDLKNYLHIAAVIILIALVMSKSLMGNMAFFCSMLVSAAIYAMAVRRISVAVLALIGGVLLTDIFVVGQALNADATTGYTDRAPVVSEFLRGSLNSNTLEMVRDYPITGTGAGSFASTYPMYAGSELSSWQFKHAHNDYLQFASELGLPGLALLSGIVLLSLWQAARALFVRQNSLMRGIACGTMMALLAMLIYGAVDFNLQIPANAATFVVILAMAWHTRWLDADSKEILPSG